MTSRLIIDITELNNWTGKLTGVPRVMNELVTRFKREDKNIVFVTWNAELMIYHETSLENKTETKQDNVVSKETTHYSVNVLKKIARKSRIRKSTVYKVKSRMNISKKENEDYNSITPGKLDVLFIMADWHGADYNFIKYLKDVKNDGCKIVQISYDLLPLVTPQYSGHSTETFKKYVTEVYPIVDQIIAISKHTKLDTQRWLKNNNLNVPKINVMRLGDDFKLSKPVRPGGRFFSVNLDKKFILTVGTIEARKNHTLLYYVYKLAKSKNIDLPVLVVVGRRGWRTDDIYELILSDPDTKDKFIFMHDSTDEELSWLYQNCQFTVYPSFYEGWGLPIAESIANGVPCVCSDTSSMPEVAINLALYFNPCSAEECLQMIIKLSDSRELKKQKQIVKKYKLYSWDHTYQEVKKYISEVK
jgi:glycosyltransferase involved in cell wall biosynthesis